MRKKDEIELTPLPVKLATIYIEGDGELVLNKMNARVIRALTGTQTNAKKAPEIPNPWEDVITAIHWLKPIGVTDTYKECDEKLYKKLLATNSPCISAFGLKKSFCNAVVRNGIDKYSTKFDNAVNIVGGLIPITFATTWIDERLMSPQKGRPVLTRLNHFTGWKASFVIKYTETVYSINDIANIIGYAGFGLGIGSGRSSGYGRYHITGIEG